MPSPSPAAVASSTESRGSSMTMFGRMFCRKHLLERPAGHRALFAHDDPLAVELLDVELASMRPGMGDRHGDDHLMFTKTDQVQARIVVVAADDADIDLVVEELVVD